MLVNYNRSLQTVADGFSLNFGKFNNTTSAYGGEAGMYSAGDGKTGDVLSFSFYTLTGAQKIEARYNGTTIASSATNIIVNTQNPPPNTEFLPANISWDSNGFDLSYNGNTIFSNVAIPGFNPGVGYKFAMAARTGAAFENLFVDDIAINTTVAPFVWSGGSGNWTTAGNWTVGTAPTTNNNWIVMSERACVLEKRVNKRRGFCGSENDQQSGKQQDDDDGGDEPGFVLEDEIKQLGEEGTALWHGPTMMSRRGGIKDRNSRRWCCGCLLNPMVPDRIDAFLAGNISVTSC